MTLMQVREESWTRAKEIFSGACELPSTERPAYLASECAGDDALRRSVESLLAAHEGAGVFLASPTGADRGPRLTDEDVFARLQLALAGRFSLERELGRGGMGLVFLARDVALDRPVAIKVLPPAYAGVPENRARFLREARTAASLSHPHIVPIHLVEEQGDLVYYVMTFVDGESLAERIRRAGPLASPDAARLVQEIAWALAYAHGRGVVHRDIKPDNILIEKGSGRALLTDFGIARVAQSAVMTRQGEMLGTLRYMSPEQLTGEGDIDGRSDLYSLGLTAYVALSGQLPFDGDRPGAVPAMYRTQPAPPLRSVNPAVPPRLAEAVDRCLAIDPEARFATGEALADAMAETRTARRPIAPSVREFLAAARSGAFQILGVAVAWQMVALTVPRVLPAGELLGHPLDPIIAALIAATGLVLFVPFLAARRVVRAGLTETDVADAVAATAAERDGGVEQELRRADWLGRVLGHPLSRVAFGGLGVAAFVFSIVLAFGRLGATHIHGAVLNLLTATFLSSLAIAPRWVTAAFTRGTPEHAGVLRGFWAGPIGRTIFRIAGIGLRRPRSTAVESAPTEVLLGRAAGALFDQLPAAQRERLGNVREVIEGLESAAATLRARRDELLSVAADAGAAGESPRRARVIADLEAARAPVEARLQEAVSALENLRLDLLRLSAGVGGADDLTAAIEEAESVRREVEIELAAQREVGSIG